MPTVFISYRQTNGAEKERVRAFGARLRDCGIEVILDQFFLDDHPAGPPDGWDKWSSDCALETENVIIIGTESWFQCFDKKQPPGEGLGAACEADDLRHRIYKANGIIENIRVVVFDDADATHISAKIERYHRFHAERDFANIVKWLGGAKPETKRLSSEIPNNLPSLQPFFGREKELAGVRDALDPESRTWGALIDGPGGMGKTSLAVRAAYDCPREQFDRIIFVSVKDREMDEDGERSLIKFLVPGFLEMLNEIARELGQKEIPKSAEDERIRLLLDALRPANALLILDNLESLLKSDRDQLFTFVKRLPQGCKAILTSRRRIGAGSELIQLEILDKDAALKTLAELATHNKLLAKTSEAERTTLWKQTGGNPLLLRWVAGQLGRGSCRTFTDALEFLSTCPKGNDPLEFIFGDLADEFTPDEEKVLVALTYFAHPVEVKHIATVAELKEEPVGTALGTLANRSLVVPNQEEQEFALVPMVAEFLRKHRPEVVRETGDRLEQRAFALILENGFEYHDRFPMLDAAWPSVAPALPLFLAGPNQRLQIVCAAIWNFLDFTGRWDEWLALSVAAEEKSTSKGDFENAGWRAFDAGKMLFRRGQSTEVLACAHRAATHFEAAKADDVALGYAIQLRGRGHQLAKDYVSAIKAFKKAVDLHRSCMGANSAAVSIDLRDLAIVEQLSGDLVAADLNLREALGIAKNIDFREGIATYTTNLADLAVDCENWAGAESLALEGLPLSEKIGRQELIASNCRHLSEALLRQGFVGEALPYAQRAVEIFTQLGSPDLAKAEVILRECEG